METKIWKAFEEGRELEAGEAAEAAGVSKDEAAKAIKKLVAEGKLYSPKRCYYAKK